jgi:hypothetical protein
LFARQQPALEAMDDDTPRPRRQAIMRG